MDNLEHLLDTLRQFRDERDWKQFHSLRNLIVSLNLEAAELLELTQWLNDSEVEAMPGDSGRHEALRDECADVLLYLLLISDKVGFDLIEAAGEKIKKNRAKYPVDKFRSSRRKYNSN